jgi:RNA polymerase sigma factor (sigma-70 family)
VIEHLRGTVEPPARDGSTDGELLQRFIDHRDGADFALLVARHAPMVWGVCRRLLNHTQDAEDAFQATFLVLVRKAASVVPRSAVGGYLHGVAYNTALKARAAAVLRGRKEQQVAVLPEPAAVPPDPEADVQQLLDQELNRLPGKYRLALVLCDLEGRSRKEAALQLKIPEGTLSSRLTTARTMLAKRLTRRGIGVSAVALAALLAQSAASASAPTAVVARTTEAAALVAAGHTAGAALISNRVAALTEGVVKAMLLGKLKLAAVVLLMAALATLGAGYLFGPLAGARAPDEKKAPPEEKKEARKGAPEAEPKGKTVPPGVPLQAKLVAKKATYTLDLGGKTPEEFRKLLKDSYPPAPAVDLELEFRNTGDKAITFLVGGFNPDVPLLLQLDGPGAVNKIIRAVQVDSPSIPPKQVTLAPGKTHTIPIKSLITAYLDREGTASYWTEVGEYTLTATYKTAVSPVPAGVKDSGGFGPVTVVSAPVRLKVVEKKAGGKTEPPGVPLEAKLVAKKATYTLDLGGKTPEEFRNLLKDTELPAPAVDLELEFRNTGDKAITFLVGGFNPDVPLLLKLDGPGAVNKTLRALPNLKPSVSPEQVTLAPGKTHTLPIKSLMTERLNREGTASYWTEPGEYTLTATYKTAVSPVPAGVKVSGGFGPVEVVSAPVKLKVGARR